MALCSGIAAKIQANSYHLFLPLNLVVSWFERIVSRSGSRKAKTQRYFPLKKPRCALAKSLRSVREIK
jgi:hypothetical protein